MSEQRDDGGPAFPEAGLSGLPNQEYIDPRPGMTLRDYFAAKAMQALLATDKAEQCLDGTGGASDGFGMSQAVAAIAYDVADAMLAERKQ